MKLRDFALSVRHIACGSPLNWKPGIPGIIGNVPLFFRNQLDNIVRFKIHIGFEEQIPEEIAGAAQRKFNFNIREQKEGYILNISSSGAEIYASGEQGRLYALQTLLRFSVLEDMSECFICDAPLVSERGLKLYLPPPTPEGIAGFKEIVGIAARYKYNFLMLELGGAMEYLSHPEINQAWCSYAEKMNEFPGKTLQIQNGFPWRKNSIHSENGGGKVVSQAQLRELIDFCRGYGFEIIPELPSLSHCDYLLAAYPEFAERTEDPFPDTACPRNEHYHRLLFDLLDEIVALFAPKRINIGHDELYTFGLCSKCAGKTPVKLYAEDINRIAARLRKLNVKTMIWSDKLLNAHFTDGTPCGGAEIPARDGKEAVPATYESLALIDPEIELFHWYWSIDRKLEQDFIKRRMKFLFGNLSPALLPEWSKRISAPRCGGFCVSNWGTTEYENLRRNGILFDLVYGAFLAWNPELGSEDYAKIFPAVKEELCALHKSRFPQGTEFISICHSTDTAAKFEYFFDGRYLREQDYLLGYHIIQDKSGRHYKLPVIFGGNISNGKATSERKSNPDSLYDRYEIDQQYIEVLGGAHPETDASGRTWYVCRYPHPCPGEEIIYLRYEPLTPLSPKVDVQ